jgi:hypothetical protein
MLNVGAKRGRHDMNVHGAWIHQVAALVLVAAGCASNPVQSQIDGEGLDVVEASSELTAGEDASEGRGDGVLFRSVQFEDNPYNTLSKWLVFDTSEPTVTRVEVYDANGVFLFATVGDTESAVSHRKGIIGLREETGYQARIVAGAGEAGQVSEFFPFVSGSLPASIPRLELLAVDAAKRLPGYTAFTISTLDGIDGGLDRSVATYMVVDREGQVVYYREPVEPGQLGGIFLPDHDGSLLYMFDAYSQVMKIGPMGEPGPVYPVSSFGGLFVDHGSVVLPDGHRAILVQCRTGQDATGQDIIDPFVVEVTRDFQPVRTLPLHAAGTAAAIKSELRDIGYDARDDTLVVLFVDRIAKLHRDTGETVWIMGGEDDEFGVGQFFPLRLHGLSVLPSGDLLVFDNGTLTGERPARPLEIEYMIHLDTLPGRSN